MIRITNLPVLLLIGLYDRQRYQDSSLWENVCDYADHTWGKITAAAGFDHLAGNRMDIETVFEAEREYGSCYDGWEDEEVFEEDETPMGGEDETVLAEAGAIQDSPIAASPEHGMFYHRQSIAPPNSPRERGHKVSMGIQAANATAMASAAAPLARVRRSSMSVYGPSPLAQLFVGGDQVSHAAHRQRTVNVGSLPATSSFPQSMSASASVSPHRQQRLSFAGLSRSTTRPSLSPMEDTIPERPTPGDPSMSRSFSLSSPLRARASDGQTSAAPRSQRLPSYGSFQESRKKPQVTFESPSPVVSPKDTQPEVGGTSPKDDRGAERAERAEVVARDYAPKEESVTQQKQKEEPERVMDPKEVEVKAKEEGEKVKSPKQPPKETWPETKKAESSDKKTPTRADSSVSSIPQLARGTSGTSARSAPGTSKATPAESVRSTPESSQMVSTGGEVPAPPKLTLPKAKQMRKPSPSAGGKMTSPLIAPTGLPGTKAPTTASELLEKLENKQQDDKSTSDRTMEQLRAIEARQTRIEEMLMRLLDGGAGRRGSDAGVGGSGQAGRRPGMSRGSRISSRGSGRMEEHEEEESRPVQIRTPRHEDPHDTFDDYE